MNLGVDQAEGGADHTIGGTMEDSHLVNVNSTGRNDIDAVSSDLLPNGRAQVVCDLCHKKRRECEHRTAGKSCVECERFGDVCSLAVQMNSRKTMANGKDKARRSTRSRP